MTHASPDWVKSRSFWIDGSATFTTVESRMIMSIPTQSTYSAVQRVRSVGAPWLRCVTDSVMDRP